MPSDLSFPAWAMLETADHPLCEKFEANVFAKSRCQNCFRRDTAHQHGNQELAECTVKTPERVTDIREPGSCDPWDPLCILVPQCEVYVCVGSEDRTESWQESLEYTQLSCTAEENSEEATTCPNTTPIIPSVEPDTVAALSKNWEMTRLLGNILGPDKGDMMYYASRKHEVRPENLHSDRPKWVETASSRRTESWSCLKAESKAMSQNQADSRRKHQGESGYFSLDRRKSEPSWASSHPQVGCSTLPVRSDATGAGRWPTSSISSADSDLSWRTSGSSESRRGLMKHEYTVLADVPKPKRLNHRQAFEKDRRNSRTCSPGRAEVERIFGQERRKSETLEAFQALEEGLLERLDSKTLKLAKEGRLVRRQSSPTLRRESILKSKLLLSDLCPATGNERLPREPEQQSRSRGESLRMGRPGQPPERSGRSQGEPLHTGRPTQRLESQSRGFPLHSTALPPQPVDRRKREEHHWRAGGAPLHAMSHGKQTHSSRKSQLEASHSSAKNVETKWKSCLETLQTASPAKSLGKSHASHQRQLERYKESDRKARGKPLLPVGTAEQPAKDPRDGQEAVRALSPGRGSATWGKGAQAWSPLHVREDGWRVQGESRRALSPGREVDIGLKSHGQTGGVLSLGSCASASQRGTEHFLSPERGRERSRNSSGESRCSSGPRRPMEASHACSKQTRCSAVSEQHPEHSWKIQREACCRNRGTSKGHDWPGQEEQANPFSPQHEHVWTCSGQSSFHTSLPAAEQKRSAQEDHPRSGKSENSRQSCEEPLLHVNPRQHLRREWVSQGEYMRSAKAGQQHLERSWKNQGSPTEWAEDVWKNQGRCPSPMRPEKQLRNDWNAEEKLLHQRFLKESSLNIAFFMYILLSHQLTEGQALKSTSTSKSQDLYLDTSQKHKELLHPSVLVFSCSIPSHWVLVDPLFGNVRKKHLATGEALEWQPDLLNFKKGWMSILDEPGEWTKHWFVLTDSSLRYYRDSNAEEADDLDGEIDLRSCTDVTEYAVQRNYGFQIHTKDGVFTLSAMTSGIRRNWIEALRKSIRPVSVPDVTKLSDCNKENSFRSYGSQKSPFKSEEQRPSSGSEVITRSSGRKTDGQRHAFDYVELAPLQQGALNQGSPQRTRGSVRATDGAAKREELERDLASRSEERRKWFESPASGVLQTDGPAGDLGNKAGGHESPGTPLSEAQRSQLSEEIERKWQELERLPLKDSKRVPLMALLNQGKGGHEDSSEALEKEVELVVEGTMQWRVQKERGLLRIKRRVQVLRSQLESLRAHSKTKSHQDGHVPHRYISQEACERSLAEMETSHQQVMAELRRHHRQEMEQLQKEKERLLFEEAAATAAAIEALKKAHREELNKELSRTRSFQKGVLDSDALHQQHRSDVESLKRELQVLSEQYSQKCLEIGNLMQKAEEQEQLLQRCQQEGKELLRQNQASG
ncbi:TRIO and F-actin-binding protein [Varanus komodoensis]|nr:TRIO and F-actin-binding protein [Varanus komodoensis]